MKEYNQLLLNLNAKQNFNSDDFREFWRTKVQFNYYTNKNIKNPLHTKNKRRDKTEISKIKI